MTLLLEMKKGFEKFVLDGSGSLSETFFSFALSVHPSL